ncbi:tetracycline resistance protein, class A-like [Solanum tuberosum]|uniref:Tetracycline transporter n=1 Tax=Solanum tuberosum TaxID=4113 RepID=M1ALP1_SOLTU|nr:PREDICTED: tetracycline resistance protein, class A-like [Solanum tuberosum]
MEKNCGLSHLFMTVFLSCFSTFMVIPPMTDITLSAICPGQDECSLAIYLTGVQQAIVGLGSLVMMPVLGNLSDIYGRKVVLTLPMTLSIFPLAILAYSRTKYYFYAYYVLRTLIAMICEGSVQCLALAYVADNVPESRRASVFGVLSGIASSAFVCGNLSARFLSTASTFQVAAAMAVIALVYMKMFLPESITKGNICSKKSETSCLLEKAPKKGFQFFKALPSFSDMLCLLKTSSTFLQAAIVSFFVNVAQVGLEASILFFLKAQFHFNKNQFADLLIISGIAGSISQLLLMPILAPAFGEEKLLSIGLFFSCLHMLLYSIAWSSWVPYACAMISILSNFAMPCLKSIASKQIGPNEQGKVQGCITGISSFASVVSPLIFSPLTALFLSQNAPFHYPGFGLACAAFASMLAFIQSLMIKPDENVTNWSVNDSNLAEP